MIEREVRDEVPTVFPSNPEGDTKTKNHRCCDGVGFLILLRQKFENFLFRKIKKPGLFLLLHPKAASEVTEIDGFGLFQIPRNVFPTARRPLRIA
jgi:hypothetical protein